MLAMGVAVAGLLLLDVVNTTLIQRIVPDALRGRAMGVLQTTSAVLYALGSLAMPIIAGVTGVGPVLIGSAVITVVGVRLRCSCPSARRARAARPGARPAAGAPDLRGTAGRAPRGGGPAAGRGAGGRGDAIVREGDAADRFYVIAEGTMRVTQASDAGGDEVHLRDLGPGDVFGEIGLLRRSARTATVDRDRRPDMLWRSMPMRSTTWSAPGPG